MEDFINWAKKGIIFISFGFIKRFFKFNEIFHVILNRFSNVNVPNVFYKIRSIGMINLYLQIDHNQKGQFVTINEEEIGSQNIRKRS